MALATVTFRTDDAVPVTYTLPQPTTYEFGYEILSVPLQMADGSIKWQTFGIASTTDLGTGTHIQGKRNITLTWAALTGDQYGTIQTVWGRLSSGIMVFTGSDNYTNNVTRHPDQKTLDASVIVSKATAYYRVTIKIAETFYS